MILFEQCSACWVACCWLGARLDRRGHLWCAPLRGLGLLPVCTRLPRTRPGPPRTHTHNDTPVQDLPLDKLGGFGGKLGEALKSMGCITAGQVQALSHATLAARFGEERAGWIEEAVSGPRLDLPSYLAGGPVCQ